MKKLYLIPLLALIVASCSDKGNEDLPVLTDKTYEGLTELNLIYNNSRMVGKSATLSDNMIIFDSKVDFGSYSDAFKGMPAIPGSGILPGTPALSIKLDLVPNKDKYSAAGSGETDFVTYSYLGSLTENIADFNFYNVKLKDTSLAGRVYKPVTANIATGASPFHIVWETSQPGLLEYFDGSIEDALKLLATLPIIPAYRNTAYMSLSQVISSGLTSLSFNEDGNLVVSYLQSANGAAQYAQAPLCMLQYVPIGNSLAKIFVNPTDLVSLIIMNNTNKPEIPEHPFGRSDMGADSSAGTLETILGLLSEQEKEQIFTSFASLLSGGFIMQYSLTADGMELFIPTEILVPLIKDVVAPMLAKPEVQQMLVAKIESVAALQPYAPLIKGMLLALPLIMETTTKAELGFSLTNY